jgi:hypothetical protein
MTYSKVGHVRDENSSLDDLGQGRASLLENGIQVLAALSGLLGNGAFNQSAIGSKGDLAGAVDGSRSLDGLRLEVIQYENDVFNAIANQEMDSRKGQGLESHC